METKITGCHNNQADTYDDRIINDLKDKNCYIREKYFEVHKEVLQFADLKDWDSVLDIGIGTGLLEERIQSRVKMFGIDISLKMMEKVNDKNLLMAGLKVGSFNDIPFKDKMFDVVLSCFAFHHLTDNEKERSIPEMKRVLKKDGRIVIGDFMYLNEKNKKQLIKNFQTEKRTDMIEEMEEENFTNVETFKKSLEGNGFNVEFNQISTISWVVSASL